MDIRAGFVPAVAGFAAAVAVNSHASAQCNTVLLNPWDSGSPPISLVGDAQSFGSYAALTPEAEDQSGAVWSAERASVLQGFDCMFSFAAQGAGAFGPGDGFAFVLQNDPGGTAALGEGGSGLGYSGLTHALAVEFDSFNFSGEFDVDHVSFQAMDFGGAVRSDDAQSIAHATLPFDMNDGAERWAYIRYRPGNLRVQVEGEILIDTFLTLADPPGGLLFDPNDPNDTCANVGFTAATGGAWSEHDVFNWSFGDTAECGPLDFFGFIPDQTVSAGQRVVVRMSPAGHGPWHFEWELEGVPVSDGGSYSGSETPFLIIDPVLPEHEGRYNYVVGNDCGGLGTSFYLRVDSGCPADLNKDGLIDLSDLSILLIHFGSSDVDPNDGDIDDDGDIDLDDLSALLVVFGTVCP